MSTTTYTPIARTGTPLVKASGQPVFSLLTSLGRVLIQWQARASDRVHLQELPDYLLTDMGLTRSDAERESTKAFWRA